MAKILEGIVKDWLMRTLQLVLDDSQLGSRPVTPNLIVKKYSTTNCPMPHVTHA